jgi:hypothetical protein
LDVGFTPALQVKNALSGLPDGIRSDVVNGVKINI